MNDRRNFLSWLTGLFVAAPVAAHANEPIWGKQGEWMQYGQQVKPEQKGFIVYTVNVGQLPPYKAEALVDRIKDKWRKDDTRKAFDAWEFIILPVRPPNESKIEIFAFNGEFSKSDYVQVQKMTRDEKPFVAPDKKQIRDYVFLGVHL